MRQTIQANQANVSYGQQTKIQHQISGNTAVSKGQEQNYDSSLQSSQAQTSNQHQIQQSSSTSQQQQPQYFVHKKVIENYSYGLNDIIGKGYSSLVYKGYNEITGEVVAIKVIDMKGIKNEVQSFLLKNEINVLKKLSSNINCLKLYDTFQTTNNSYIITEYCNHGDLKALIEKHGLFTEKPAVKIIDHLLNGIQEMQSQGIIHRDLKLANILVKENIPKIADFGFSKDLYAEPCKIYYNVGTPMYMCPQSLKRNEYSFSSDIWSIGVLFYEMIYGRTPWIADTETQLAEIITNIPVHFPSEIDVSADLKDFIRGCLQVDENQRITLSEMRIHPIFKILTKSQNQIAQIETPKSQVKLSQLASIKVEINGGQTAQKISQTNIESEKPRQINLEQNINIPKELSHISQIDGTIILTERVINEEKIENEIILNEKIIQSQISLCNFLDRVCGLLDQIGYNILDRNQKKKLNFTLRKLIQIKRQQLGETFIGQENSFNLNFFPIFQKSEFFKSLSPFIFDQYHNYNLNFKKFYEQSLQELQNILDSDKQRFTSILSSLKESEIFYLTEQEYLREVIRSMSDSLQKQQISSFIEDHLKEEVILLDYLIVLYQLNLIILEKFDDYQKFGLTSRIQEIAEGNIQTLTKKHFEIIQKKIKILEI